MYHRQEDKAIPISLGSAYGEILIGTDKAEKDTRSLAETMRDVGTGMSLAISTPLLAVAGAGLKAAAGFEESMNLIQTVGSATAEQMQNVQAQALQLGKDTSFSAGEAAEGFLELTKAGFSIESSMSAIGGVLDLAAAGNLSVASAAEIAANAINAFQLPASDSVRIADLLAAGANASSVEVTDLSDSLKMSGSVMSSYGQSLDDTVTALGLLGNAGLKGSDAGTSLKQMFISLAAPTDKSLKLMKSLGINIYDAQGAMLPFEDILYRLQDGFAGMTEEQRNVAMATVFGSDAVRAANILLQAGEDGWTEMSSAVRKGGAAAEVAASRQKGFNGAMEYFKGTMESLLIEVLLPFLDTLSGGLRWIADLVALFTQLPRPVQYAALAFLAVLAAIGPVLLALSGVATVLGFLLSPIGLIGVAIAALAAAWVSNWGDIQGKVQAAWDYIKPIFDNIVDWLQNTAGQALEWLRAKWNEVWPQLQNAVAGMWSIIEPIFISVRDWVKTKIGEGLIALQSAWETTWTALQTATQSAWEAISPHLQTALDWVKENLPNALPTLQTIWETTWTAIQAATQSAWESMKPTLDLIIAWLKDDLPPLVSGTQTSWETMWTSMSSAVQTAKDMISTAWDALAGLFGPTIDKLIESFNKMISGFQELGPEFTKLGESAQKAFGPIGEILLALGIAFGAVVYGVMIFGLNMLASAFEVLPEIVRTAAEVLTALFTGLAEVFQGVVDLFKAIITGDWNGMWNSAGRIVAGVGIMITGIWNAVVSAITILWTWMADTVTGTLEDLGVDVEAGLATISAAWDASWEAMRSTWTTVAAVFIAGFVTLRTWFTITLPNAVNALQNKMEATWNAIKSFLLDSILAPIIAALDGWRTFMMETLPNAINSFKNFLGNLRLPNPFSGLIDALSTLVGWLQTAVDWVNQLLSGLNNVPGWAQGLLGGGGASASSAQPVAPSSFNSPQLAGTGNVNVNVNIDAGGISSGVDVEALAYRVANRTVEEIRRRVR